MKVRMMMTRWSVLVTAMFGALGVLGALAAPAAAGGEVALSAGVLPSGSVDVMQAGQSAGGDMDTGFLLTGAAGKWVTPQLRVAAAVALVPSARPSGLPEEVASPRLLSPGLRVDGLRPLAASGGLYAFERFRAKAIADFFASQVPPPTPVAAEPARQGPMPRYLDGIGTLTAVRDCAASVAAK